MNKRQLSKAVAVHSDVDFKTVTTVLDGFTDVVTAVVSQGERVIISGFAKFVKVDRPSRMGRNPATGEAIRIKASKKARITPVKAFKDAVMTPSQAPRLKKGAFPIVEELVRKAGKVVVVKPAARAAKPKRAAAKRTAVRKPAARRKTTTRATAPKRRAVAKRTTARKAAPARKPAARRRTAARRR